MLIEWFLSIKSLPNLLFGVLCLPGGQSHPFEQPTINPLACCICWAGLLGCAVFPPWNEGPNSGSYNKRQNYKTLRRKHVTDFIAMQSKPQATKKWIRLHKKLNILVQRIPSREWKRNMAEIICKIHMGVKHLEYIYLCRYISYNSTRTEI